MAAHTIFLNPFTVGSWCKRKFVVCPFVDEETNGSYPFANGLNELAHLVTITHEKFRLENVLFLLLNCTVVTSLHNLINVLQ
jgi:hypothetical protein